MRGIGLAIATMIVGMGAFGEVSDAALVAAKIVLQPGPEYAADTRPFQGIPSIARAENGRLWATWYGGGPGEGKWNYVLLYTSGDDGKTWEHRLVIDPQADDVRAFDPNVWIDPKGRLWSFWAQGYGGDRKGNSSNIWDGRGGVWAIVSENPGDADATFSPPRRLCNGIMMNKPTVTKDGAWLLPASVWRVGRNEAYGLDLVEERGANVVGSRDEGRTWARFGGARPPDAAFDEHMLVERNDGSLWMLLRTQKGIGESVSTDGGRTWSEGTSQIIKPLPSARFFIRRLQSGTILLVRHDPPDGKTRSHLTAFLSDDDGATWKGGLMLDERKGVSYPDGVVAPDGSIYVIYDYDRYGEREILMAEFNESDVLAGEFASPNARQRVLVHKATGPVNPK